MQILQPQGEKLRHKLRQVLGLVIGWDDNADFQRDASPSQA